MTREAVGRGAGTARDAKSSHCTRGPRRWRAPEPSKAAMAVSPRPGPGPQNGEETGPVVSATTAELGSVAQVSARQACSPQRTAGRRRSPRGPGVTPGNAEEKSSGGASCVQAVQVTRVWLHGSDTVVSKGMAELLIHGCSRLTPWCGHEEGVHSVHSKTLPHL